MFQGPFPFRDRRVAELPSCRVAESPSRLERNVVRAVEIIERRLDFGCNARDT